MLTRAILALALLLGATDAEAASPASHQRNVQAPVNGLFTGGWNGGSSKPAWQAGVAFTGRPADLATDFVGYSAWSQLQNPGYEVGGWGTIGVQNILALPMFITGGTLANCSAGAYDSYYHLQTASILAFNPGALIIRLGWEFNLSSFPWTAQSNASGYIACWQHIVNLYRGDGVQAQFMWDVNYGTQAIDFTTVYPGDAYVDAIGMDFYPNTQVQTQAQFNSYATATDGLNTIAAMAVAHNKPLMFPEVGCGNGLVDSDCANFVSYMHTWAQTNNVYQLGWWDSTSGYDSSFADYPLTGAQVKAKFYTPNILSFSPATGPPATVVDVYGSQFTKATVASVNGTSAAVTWLTDGHLQVTVPGAATTGAISIQNPAGAASSSTSFTVTTAAAAISIANGQFVNSSGAILQLRGFNMSGLENSAAQGSGSDWADDGIPQWSVYNTWAPSIVRFPLNAASWLGLTCYNTASVSVTFTATPASGATSATLSTAWTGASGTYPLNVNGNNAPYTAVTLANGATTATFSPALSAAAPNANAVVVVWGTGRSMDPYGTYKNSVETAVAAANNLGIFAIIDQHWTSPNITIGGVTHCLQPLGQSQFADTTQSDAFWKSIADTFGTEAASPLTGVVNSMVLFEGFNEPYFNQSGSPFTAGTADQALGNNGTAFGIVNNSQGFANFILGYTWTVETHQAMLNTIRGEGAHNIYLFSGNAYSQQLAPYATYIPTDSLSPAQIAAIAHPYVIGGGGSSNPYPYTTLGVGPAIGGDNGYGTPAATDIQYAKAVVAAGVPLMFTEDGGEGGTSATATPYAEPHMAYEQLFADEYNISYVAWQWNGTQAYGTSAAQNYATVFASNGTTILPILGEGTTTYNWMTAHPASNLPIITSLSTTSCAAGATITLTGSRYSTTTGVKINGGAVTYSITAASGYAFPTQMVVTCPNLVSAYTGPIVVTNKVGSTSSANITVAAGSAPGSITFTPSSGYPSQVIAITGTSFIGTTALTLNGTTVTSGNYVVNSNTSISLTIPSGATSGVIAITNAVGTGTSGSSLTITADPRPNVTSVSPTSGVAGQVVTFTGTNFTNSGIGANFLCSGAYVAATATSFTSSTSMTATAPSCSTSTTGPVQATNSSGTKTGTANFTLGPSIVINSLSPNNGHAGSTFLIQGVGFTGTTNCWMPYSSPTITFTVNSDTQITATVPSEATGTYQVTCQAAGNYSFGPNFTIN